MPNTARIDLPVDELRQIVHALGNSAFQVESFLSLVEADPRLPEALRAEIQDAATGSRTMSAAVRRLQKLIG